MLFVLSVIVAVAFAHWFYPPGAPMDEVIVVATSVGTAFAFFTALIGKMLKLTVLSRLAERVVFVLIPLLALIFLVLGTIFLGVATPTEGGAMGATGALIMALARGRLSWKLLKQAHGHHGAAHRIRRVHPGRRARVQPHVLRRERPRVGRGICWSACPAGSWAS